MRHVRFALVIALVAVGRPVWADDAATAREAKAHHDAGTRHYQMGRYDQAVVEFEKAFDLDPHATLVFNLAQAHRQRGDAERAVFFYRRYLMMAPAAADRADVERRIHDLDLLLARQKEIRDTPPADLHDRASDPQALAVASKPPGNRTPPLRLSLGVGAALPFVTGGRDVGTPTLFASRVAVEWAMSLPRLSLDLDLGLAATFSPVSHRGPATGAQGSSRLWGALLTAGLRRAITPAWSGTLGLGAGVLWWSGLSDDNPFTETGAAPAGAVAMPTLRTSAGIVRSFGHLFVAAGPALTVSRTTGSSLSPVSGVVQLDLTVSVGGKL